jgi:hypothetical protein
MNAMRTGHISPLDVNSKMLTLISDFYKLRTSLQTLTPTRVPQPTPARVPDRPPPPKRVPQLTLSPVEQITFETLIDKIFKHVYNSDGTPYSEQYNIIKDAFENFIITKGKVESRTIPEDIKIVQFATKTIQEALKSGQISRDDDEKLNEMLVLISASKAFI